MTELKAGDTKTFDIGGEKLTVGPIPFGRLKRIVKLVADASATFEKKDLQDDLLKIVPKLLEEKVYEFVPLILDPKAHPFLTQTWIDENLTIPTIKEIIVTAITVNALGDFFNKTVTRKAPLTVEEKAELLKDPLGTTETPSASTGSITSSDSPTDGSRETLTS